MTEPRAPQTPPSFFDIFTGSEGPAIEAAGFVLETLARAVRDNSRWIIETAGDRVVAVENVSFEGQRLAFSLRAGAAAIDIALSVDSSGWIGVFACRDGVEVFRGYLDRPFEEFEFWPAGFAVSSPREGEAPGRIGKRGNWINLLAGAWPQLALFANAHGVVGAMDEDSHLNNPAISLE